MDGFYKGLGDLGRTGVRDRRSHFASPKHPLDAERILGQIKSEDYS